MLLPRLQLIELEDQPWWPRTLRDAMTDYLQAVTAWFDPYRPVAPLLAAALLRSGTRQVVDLGSGGGGPWFALGERLSRAGVPLESITLTDAFPNVAAFGLVERSTGGRTRGFPTAVDASAVPDSLPGFRTMFTAFHHFPPRAAEAILSDAVRHGRGIAVFEMTRRSVLDVLGMIVFTALLFIVTPWIRPFRWSRLVWTYVIPVLPLSVLIDSVVSSLRSYTPGELRELAAATETEGSAPYQWEAGLICTPVAAAPVTYLIGTPRARIGALE